MGCRETRLTAASATGLGIDRSPRLYALFHRSFREDPDIVLDGAVLEVGNFRANLSFNIGAILGRELFEQAFGHVPDDLFNLKFSSHTRIVEVGVVNTNRILPLARHSLRVTSETTANGPAVCSLNHGTAEKSTKLGGERLSGNSPITVEEATHHGVVLCNHAFTSEPRAGSESVAA